MANMASTTKHLVTGALSRLSSNGHIRVPILLGPARGLKIEIDPKLAEWAFVRGTYEKSVTKTICETCQPGWTVWECGTHIGYLTLILSRLVGPHGKVIGFEPDPENRSRTQRNVELNRFAQTLIVGKAIGGAGDSIEFVSGEHQTSHIMGAYTGGLSLKQTEKPDPNRVVRVDLTRLDDELQNQPQPQLIKLDIEGAELLAFDFAHRVARDVRPVWFIELHNPECEEAMWKFMETHKYKVYDIASGDQLKTYRPTTFVKCLP